MRGRLFGAVVFAVLLAGCAAEATEIVVVVDSDIPVPSGIDEIDVRVSNEVAMMQTATLSLGGAGAGTLPATVGVRPQRDESATITIVATALLAHGEVVHETVRTRFVPKHRVLLSLFLADACRGVVCGVDQTCMGGTCTSVAIDPSRLPPFTGTIPHDGGVIDAGLPDTATPDGGMPEMSLPDLGVDSGMTMFDGGGPECVMTPDCAAGRICCGGSCITSCDDGIACTIDTCDAAGCTHVPNDTACDDGRTCTRDHCVLPGGCTFDYLPLGASCDDGSVCTTHSECDDTGNCLYNTTSIGCSSDLTCATFPPDCFCDPILGCQNFAGRPPCVACP